MALEQWKWYVYGDGDKDPFKMPYYANMPQTIDALDDYITKECTKKHGGFFKRFFRKLFHIKEDVCVNQIFKSSHSMVFVVNFKLKNTSDKLQFTFETYHPNEVMIQFGLGKESILFNKNECSVADMFKFMKGFAEYTYICISSKRIYTLEAVIEHFFDESNKENSKC